MTRRDAELLEAFKRGVISRHERAGQVFWLVRDGLLSDAFLVDESDAFELARQIVRGLP